MDDAMTRGNTLVVPSNFVHAIRDSGYLSVAHALAELVDNSIQAGATTVDIHLDRPAGATHPRIRVEDNGSGMSRGELENCLRFGGSSRFAKRDSFGRFGMGLPAASLSQTRSVQVETWRSRDTALSVSLDIDEVASGRDPRFTPTRGRAGASDAGSRITWHDCDRIEYSRLGWLERSLRRDLGRIYRRFIATDLMLTLNGKRVDAVDPLMLTHVVEGVTASVPFEPTEYVLPAPDGTTATVRVRFSLLPVDAWHDLDKATKRRTGIVRGAGVSILRAGREIAFGWHLMGGKRKENYDDWWRCEIDFDPELDEHFGITVNKQGIRPSQALREALEPQLEAVARLLNARARQAFEDMKFRQASELACRIAQAADRELPVLATGQGDSALRYRISTTELPDGAMFNTVLAANTLDLQLNVDHPAFKSLYGPLQTLPESDARSLRTAVELLMLAFARTALGEATKAQPLVASWGATYARMLQRS